jgi:ABC-type antimicrobial peptide transport system permease subunit
MLWLLGGCTAMVVALSILSVLAAVAQFLAAEKRSLAVRMALGAGLQHVALVIYRHLMWVLIVGMASGAAAGIALSRTLDSQIFGLSVSDPTTITGALVLLALACLAPGLWALAQVSRLDLVRELKAQ